ncbi:MAG: hypothetical protein HRU18_03610 [Pseudoalteromonas sp.]|uniref:hypothetical protein n=1 Tax=Pseudoalteromonas sp. TaxID=53249 RepID=UPI001D51A252|nr:hypothetical protein [Pseudoalteromonas sp.]NRA77273.1 hypothetical protein [Pseudoalteromonas sp.]
MIDLVFQTLRTITNKDNQGYLSPTEFNLLANNVQEEIFRGYFEDENRDKNKENRGLTNKGFSNLDFNERQRIYQFSAITDITKNQSTFRFDLPSDLYFIEDDGVTPIEKGVPSVNFIDNVIEEVERSAFNYLSNSESAATSTYPIYERYATEIVVSPSTIEDIRVRYLRRPTQPNWTYFLLPNGKEVFDPSNTSYQDFDLHESEFSNIVNRMLSYFGINLRENEIIQIAEMLKDKQNVEDNG